MSFVKLSKRESLKTSLFLREGSDLDNQERNRSFFLRIVFKEMNKDISMQF